MANTLANFPVGTTVVFTVTFKISGVAPDITGDTVTLTLKANIDDTDPGALQVAADVTTQGASGKALFELTPAQTDIMPRTYFYDIRWITSAAKEYVPEFDSNQVKAVVSVSDL